MRDMLKLYNIKKRSLPSPMVVSYETVGKDCSMYHNAKASTDIQRIHWFVHTKKHCLSRYN